MIQTYRRHRNLSLESSPDSVIDTLGFPPADIETFVPITLVAVEVLRACVERSASISQFQYHPGLQAARASINEISWPRVISISKVENRWVGGAGRRTLLHDRDVFLCGDHRHDCKVIAVRNSSKSGPTPRTQAVMAKADLVNHARSDSQPQ